MARELWLLRHGDAERHGSRPDAERRLTASGREQAERAGMALARLGLAFTELYSSPRVRALDTARLAAPALAVDVCVHDPLSGAFGHDDALVLLGTSGTPVLLVGHEPDFSQLIHAFTGASVDLKKGGIAGMRLTRTGAVLLVLLRPREIELLSRD